MKKVIYYLVSLALATESGSLISFYFYKDDVEKAVLMAFILSFLIFLVVRNLLDLADAEPKPKRKRRMKNYDLSEDKVWKN